jgi:hypothetical protein
MSPQLRADLLSRYLTLDELAKAINRHPQTVLRWTKLPSGALPYTTMGKQKLTTQQWWDEWLSWSNPAAYARTVARSYRRDFWDQQPARCEVWSEKGTIRGVLAPTLDEYGVGFRVMHGFASATAVYDVAQDNDGRPLVALYVGDYDPSGMFMSEHDLPDRLENYGGEHVELRRIALKREQTPGLLSFPAAEKKADKRYRWFVGNFGQRCWELDALDPNVLRNIVQTEIKREIEPKAWARCITVNKAEQASLRHVLDQWKASR